MKFSVVIEVVIACALKLVLNIHFQHSVYRSKGIFTWKS